MRNRIGFLTFTFILTINICSGQKAEVEFLIRPSLYSMRGNQAVKNNLNPTFNLTYGLSGNFNIDERKFITTTILYEDISIKGRLEVQSMQNVDTVELEYNYKYVTIPVQWGYRFGKKTKYQFGVGIYGGYLIKVESIQKSSFYYSIDDQTDLNKSFDFGVSISFKTYIPLTEKIIASIGIDNNLGLLNTSAVPVFDGGTIKHNSTGIIIGLNLRLN